MSQARAGRGAAPLTARAVQDKERLSALADNVMKTLEVIVQRTQEKVDSSTETLQNILTAAAEDDGEVRSLPCGWHPAQPHLAPLHPLQSPWPQLPPF